MTWRAAVLLLGLAGWGAAPLVQAHQVSAVGAEAKFFRDGTYEFGLSLEVEASLDPDQNDEISPEQAVLDYLRAEITFLFDGNVVQPQFSLPRQVAQEEETAGVLPRVQLYTVAEGRIPPGAQAFYARLSSETEVALVLLVERDGVRERRAQALFAGETSRPVDLTFLSLPRLEGDPFEAGETGQDGAGPERQSDAGVALTRVGAAWFLREGGRAAVLLVAILMVGISPQAAGAQTLSYVGGVFLGQVLLGLGAGPLGGRLGTVLGAILLIGIAADNWRDRAELTWIRYALAALTGCLLSLTVPGTMNPQFWVGQLLAALAAACLFWLILGGFWRSPWYGGKLRRPASWVFLGIALFWLGEGLWNR